MKKNLKFKNLLFLSIFILLSSCGKKTIDFDDERDYIKFERSITNYKGSPYTGVIVSYRDDEKTQLNFKRTYEEGKKNGSDEDYYSNGQLSNKETWKDGKQHGPYERYYENGKLIFKGTYKDGKKDGQWEHYDENGKLMEKESGMYKDGVKQDD